MALVVDVPLNTAIADLDEALRLLLKRELDKHGFEGVEVEFDAPSKEWSGKLTGPTVDLFLYDLREAGDRAELTPTETRENGLARVSPPPLHLELSYAVTAWTKAVEDEHRLLSQVLAVLFSYQRLPDELLQSLPDGGTRLKAAETSVGRPREEKADFWTSVGGQYKASVDFVVHVTIESGAVFVRGPEVRVPTLRASLSDRPAATVSEFHRLGGTVRDAEGRPVPGAWVALPDEGRWAAADQQGRFHFPRIAPGSRTLIARTPAGEEAKLTVKVPGEAADLVVRDQPARGRKR
jgi:Pvc16 N-terminal domain/Carboxypeptidase regulatory-like domain